MVKSWRSPTGKVMLGDTDNAMIIDEAHMMLEHGQGTLVSELVCLSQVLRISLLLLTGTLQPGE
jgi:hypothetical protein